MFESFHAVNAQCALACSGGNIIGVSEHLSNSVLERKRRIYLFIYFPLILNCVTSQLTHCALPQGIVQHEEIHFFENFSLFFLPVYLTLHAPHMTSNVPIHRHDLFVHVSVTNEKKTHYIWRAVIWDVCQ